MAKSAMFNVRSNAVIPMKAADTTLIGHNALKPLMATVLCEIALCKMGSATNTPVARRVSVARIVCAGKPVPVDSWVEMRETGKGITENRSATGTEQTTPNA
jgi:hypothetical protein